MRSRLITSLSIAASLAVGATSHAALLTNGDFSANDGSNPTGWYSWKYSSSGDSSAGWTNYTNDGTSAYISSGSFWNATTGWFQVNAATAGASYTFSADVKTENWGGGSTGNPQMHLIFLAADQSTVLGETDQDAIPGGWGTLTDWTNTTIANQVAPAGTAYVKTEFFNQGETAQFDNAVLTATPEPASLGLLTLCGGLLLKRRRTVA